MKKLNPTFLSSKWTAFHLFFACTLMTVFLSNAVYGNPYVDARFLPVTDCVESDLYCVNVQIKGEDGADYIGTSSIRISYDSEVLFFTGNSIGEVTIGSFSSINFDDDQTSLHPDCEEGNGGFGITPYSLMGFDGLSSGDILMTQVLLNPSIGDIVFACPAIESVWTDVTEICFEVLEPDADPDLIFAGTQNGPAEDESGTNFNTHTNNSNDKYWNGTFEELHLSYNELCASAGEIFGCMDPVACNYNSSATVDLGDCSYSGENCTCDDIAGCTDSEACNYTPLANCDNGSCDFYSCLIDIELSLTADVEVIELDDTVTFTITATNNGPAESDDFVVFFPLPLEMELVSISCSCAIFYPEFNWLDFELSVGESDSFSITVLATEVGSYTMIAEVLDSSEDIDSTPDNNDPTEDDQAEITISVLSLGQGTPDDSNSINTVFTDDSNSEYNSQYNWLNAIVNPNNCNGEIISVYESGGYQFVLVETNESTNLYFQDGTFYCADAENYSCVNAYGFTNPVITWTCNANNEMPTIFNDYPWLSSLVNPADCLGESLVVYQLSVHQFFYIDGVLYFQDGTFYCADSEGYDCVQLYGLSEVVAVWDCQNEMPIIETEQLFSDYSWLNSLVDLTDCEVENVLLYTDGNFDFLFIDGDLYFEDGTYYCSDAVNYSCVSLYGLTLSASWTCGVNDAPINEPCVTDTIMACTEALQPIQICIEPEMLCTFEEGEYSLAEVVSTFSSSITILNDTCFRYIPLPGFESVGEDIVIITVCDTEASNCEDIYTMIQVGDCNLSNTEPNAQNDSYEVLVGAIMEIEVLLNDYDFDGDELSFDFAADDLQPTNGNVVFVDSILLYVPNPSFVGFDSFTYTITDGNGGFDQAIVTIAIVEENPCNADFAICREPFPAEASEVCIDFCTEGVVIEADGLNPLFFESSITLVEGTTNCFSYLPLPGFTGDEVIEVEACNPNTGECETVYVGITTSEDCLEDKPAPNIEADAYYKKEATVLPIDFEVYPNPSNGKVFVEINANIEVAQIINIYDLSGRSIMQKQIPSNTSESTIELNLFDLPSGYYLLELQSQNDSFVQRLILE